MKHQVVKFFQAGLCKQSFRPPFPKGGRARARGHSRPLGLPLRRRTRPRGFASKVFVHLFQKVADSKGSAFGRWPQPAERSYTLGVFGGLGAFTRERPPRPLFFAPIRRETASPMGRWRAAPEGALAICLPAPSGGFGGVSPPGVFRHPAGGVVGSRPDRRVTFLCKQESNQRSCQGASAGPLDPRRCRSRLAAALCLQLRA